MNHSSFEQHSIPKSIFLHLFPGIVIGLAYYLLIPFVRSQGYPSVMALSLAGIISLVPIELGILIYKKNKTGRLINGVLSYCRRLPLKDYFIWVPVVFFASGLIFTLLGFVGELSQSIFRRLNTEYILDMGLNSGYSKEKLIVTYGLFFVLVVIIFPAIEELYFRGFLLPRMPKKLGKSAPILHSALFALYHTWTPWMFITRTAGVLPLIYIVRKKENILIGIIAHCIINSIDFFTALFFILNYS